MREDVLCGKAEMESRCLDCGLVEMKEKEVGVGVYLWSRETWEERPPNEEAMVLNSTCLISGFDEGLDGSTWTM